MFFLMICPDEFASEGKRGRGSLRLSVCLLLNSAKASMGTITKFLCCPFDSAIRLQKTAETGELNDLTIRILRPRIWDATAKSGMGPLVIVIQEKLPYNIPPLFI